jgi:hypothetical protein
MFYKLSDGLAKIANNQAQNGSKYSTLLAGISAKGASSQFSQVLLNQRTNWGQKVI